MVYLVDLGDELMKYLLAAALLSTSSMALAGVNCAAKPNHPQCSDTPTPDVSNGLPVVINGDGSEIGRAFKVGTTPIGSWEQRSYADVRIVRGGVATALRFYGDQTIGIADNGFMVHAGWYSSSCFGKPDFLRYSSVPVTTPGLEPFYSADYRTVQLYWASSPGPYLVRLGKPVTGVATYTNGTESACYALDPTVEISPIVEIIDLTDGIVAPISFEP